MSTKCANRSRGLLHKISVFRRNQRGCPSGISAFSDSILPLWSCRNFMTISSCFTRNQFLCGRTVLCKSSAGPSISNGYVEQRRYRRQPIVYTKEINFDYSGDLKKVAQVDPNEYLYKYRNLPEVENAPEAVKKLLSLEFADRDSRKKHWKYDIIKHIDTHLDGDVDKEKIIARWTMEIRNQISHCLVYRGDKKGKVNLIEKIAARKKQLKFLRRLDFERFLWLLHELKIRYTPFPRYYVRITKRYKRKQEVRKQARELWDSKMEAFKKSVEAEKAEFYKKKEKMLEEMQKDMQDLNIDENKVFGDFQKSLEPPKHIPVNKNYQRILRNYEEAVNSGKFVPKQTMSPIR